MKYFSALKGPGVFVLLIIFAGILWGTEPAIYSHLPGKIDPARTYLFYLHGQIIEEQGRRPTSPRFGVYEYDQILQTLAARGFVVISEARPKGTRPQEYAQKVARQVDSLLTAGVSPRRITVVGASKGAGIALLASNLLRNRELNFVLIAICNPRSIAYWKKNGIALWGRVLSIYDSSDTIGQTCRDFFDYSSQQGGLSRYREVKLHLGLGHGVLYRPLKEWVNPVVEWATFREEK